LSGIDSYMAKKNRVLSCTAEISGRPRNFLEPGRTLQWIKNPHKHIDHWYKTSCRHDSLETKITVQHYTCGYANIKPRLA